MKKYYEFRAHFGRFGTLCGRFVAEEDAVESIMGRTLYFGEVLGKHSDIYLDLEDDHISVVTDDQDFLAKAESLGVSLDTGYVPFDYLPEDDEESDEDSDECTASSRS